MNIVVIYGSPRKGNTYEAVRIAKDEIQKLGEVEFKEFYLPQDMPAFCKGCFQCILKGESKCPEAKYIKPIEEAMLSADGIIISTPVYVLQVSGALKAFFDHMAYCYLNHRPRFFRQKAMVITTTAGAGIGNCNKYISKNLSFWGINKIYKHGEKMMAIDWDDMPVKRKTKAWNRYKKVARAFYEDIDSQKMHSPSFLQVIMFNAGKALANIYEESSADKKYWMENGWMEKGCRYFIEDAKPGIIKNIVGKLTFHMFRKIVK